MRLGRVSLASIHYKMEVIHPGYVSSSKSRGLMKAVNKVAKNSLSLLPQQPLLTLYQWTFLLDTVMSFSAFCLMKGAMPHLLKVL